MKAVIGLEFHCELKSHTKVFSPALNQYNTIANKNVSVIDMAFPGTLPSLNKECMRKAIKMAYILNCEISSYMEFDRKNYFYPDLPKGYQITQFYNPVGVNGKIIIDVNGIEKEVLIHDIHLEEDTASLDHFDDYSALDYNRCGVPLLEIVTEPCFNNADEVVCFLETLRSIYQYTGISDADSKKGQTRCDVNISIMEDDATEYGTRVEVKNVNSFANVRQTINYEIERQTKLKEAGRYSEVVRETRRFDEPTGTTIRMRSKEEEVDYKYFPEPNIPRYKITKDLINDIIKEIPVLASERKNKYILEYNLSEYDSNLLVKDKKISDYFEECLKYSSNAKSICNFITTRLLGEINKRNIEIDNLFIKPKDLGDLVNRVDNGKITNNQAKEILTIMLDEEKSIEEIIKERNMEIIEDDELLTKYLEEVIKENEQAVNDYNKGRTNMLDYLVGQVMKKSKGKANPSVAKQMLKEMIS